MFPQMKGCDYMRILFTICLPILLVAAISVSQRPIVNATPIQPLVEKLSADGFLSKQLYPTVRISTLNTSQFGTGVIVRSDKVGDAYHNVVITAGHCVQNPMAFYTADVADYEDEDSFKEWTRHPLKVYATDPDLDLAVAVFRSYQPVSVATLGFGHKLKITDIVSHLGCGAGDQPRFDSGEITGKSSKVGEHSGFAYRTSIHCIPGDSGGAVFHNAEVIGFVQAIKVVRFQNVPQFLPKISFVIPVDRLKEWDAKENNRLAFLYNARAKLPAQPFHSLDFINDWPQPE